MGIEKKSNLSGYMWYTSTSLKLVGLWPTGSGGILNFTYFLIVAATFIAQVFQMITNMWMNFTDFESAAESIGPMMALITSFGKMCIYRRERSRLGHLAVSLENCIKNGPLDVLEHLENYAKISSLACGSLLVVSWLLTVVFLSAPILLQQRVLPFPSYYPYDYEHSTILYVMTYAHEAILTCLGCCTMSTEITFVWSIFHCCSRLRVLSHELSNLSNQEDNDDDKIPDKISSKLSSIMDLHYEVLSFHSGIWSKSIWHTLISLRYFSSLLSSLFAALVSKLQEVPRDRVVSPLDFSSSLQCITPSNYCFIIYQVKLWRKRQWGSLMQHTQVVGKLWMSNIVKPLV
uniref:Odorant receptor n=1 Tax=Campoletis chlorideae TaxID=219166 RepID=A0A346D453_9HYME|nr:odorant receptor [Campoletis chlorideae]